MVPGVFFKGNVPVTAHRVGARHGVDGDLGLGLHPQVESGDAIIPHQGSVVFQLGLKRSLFLDVEPLGAPSCVVVAGPQTRLFRIALSHVFDGLGPRPNLGLQSVAVVGFGVVLRTALQGEQVIAAAVPTGIRRSLRFGPATRLFIFRGLEFRIQQCCLLGGQTIGFVGRLLGSCSVGFQQRLRVHLHLRVRSTVFHQLLQATQPVFGIALFRLQKQCRLVSGLGRHPILGIKGLVALSNAVFVFAIEAIQHRLRWRRLRLVGLRQIHNPIIGLCNLVVGIRLIGQNQGGLLVETNGIGVILAVEILVGLGNQLVVFLAPFGHVLGFGIRGRFFIPIGVLRILFLGCTVVLTGLSSDFRQQLQQVRVVWVDLLGRFQCHQRA